MILYGDGLVLSEAKLIASRETRSTTTM